MKCDLSLKHSRRERNILKIVAAIILSPLLFLTIPADTTAQMFSIGEEWNRFDVPTSEFYAGMEPISISYYGSDTSPQAGGFEFSGSLIRLRYETPGINLFLATGGMITGIDNHSYFDVGGKLDFGMPVYRSERVSVEIPLELKSIYTTITNSQFIGTASSFRFGSILIGAGARMRVRFQDDLRLELAGIPSYGLTFASGGFFGGSLGMLAGRGRIYFDRLFGELGLSLGYDYGYRNYNVDEALYDYRMNAHSIQLGITF